MDLRAVLVDDEQLARDELGYLLGQLGGVEVIGQAGDGVEALTTIGRLQPDIVFLDVQMPGLTGFEVARRMLDRGSASHIIFVTAYDQHAIEAFEVNAVDYLLKPVDPARLELALQRAQRRRDVDRSLGPDRRLHRDQRSAGEDRPARHRAAEPARPAGDQGRRAFPARAGRGDHLRVARRREHHGRQPASTSAHRTTGRSTSCRRGSTRHVFWRVHRSHLVNINKIKEIVPWFSRNYILRMKDEKSTEIPVSRTQTRRLREYLKL